MYKQMIRAALIAVVAMAAAAGCRSENWRPTFGENGAGYEAVPKEVFVILRPHDQFTIDDLAAERLVIENLFAWSDTGKPVRARWAREDSKMGWMLVVYVDASQATRRIEVQGTVVHASRRVRDVFHARWDVAADQAQRFRLAGFSDNVVLVAPTSGKAAATGKAADDFTVATPGKTGDKPSVP
jgi:hypothetical protein